MAKLRVKTRVSLDEIEQGWLSAGPRAIGAVIRAHPTESFYAAAFHLFYSDYSQILAPALAINAESFVTSCDVKDSASTTQWAPPDWRWPVLDDACDAMKPLYARLTDAMTDASKSDWDELVDVHDEMMARVCRKLTAQAQESTGDFQDLNLPDDFLVAVLEGQRDLEHYVALVCASVERERLAKLTGILCR